MFGSARRYLTGWRRVVAGGPALLVLAGLACVSARAQDTRQVAQPAPPPACAALSAQLAAPNGVLAAADDNKLDTSRIQQALNTCAPGRSVVLEPDGPRNAFLSGPLHLRSGVTLRIAAGAILFASRNPRDYDVQLGSCGILNVNGRGCRALITGLNAAHAGVMGPGTIDGRGGEKMLGSKISWWQLARQAQHDNLSQNCPRLIVLSHCDDFTLYDLRLQNSPNFHVAYANGDGFTAWGVLIDTPATARNTDGIDPISATNVTITHCFIHAGDDQVAIKAGSAGPASHMTIAHNHFYTGHGISIGSETSGGVSAIRVEDLSIDGADNGIRIKSNDTRGGLVHDVAYNNVCIRDTKNPIMMDTHYSFRSASNGLIPEFRDITLQNVRVLGGGKITLIGYDAAHRLQMALDNVLWLPDPPRIPLVLPVPAAHSEFNLRFTNLQPQGDDVTVHREPAQQGSDPCGDKFVPLPPQPIP